MTTGGSYRRMRRPTIVRIALIWALSQAAAFGLRPLITGLQHERDLDAFLNNEFMSFGLYMETSGFAMSGLLLGLALWLLMRDVVPRAWLLVPLTVAGWLGVATIFIVGEFVGGLLIGGLQWIALRRMALRAPWLGGVWLAVSTVGWLVGFEIGQQIGHVLIPQHAFDPTPAPHAWPLRYWALPTAGGMALGGLIYGVVQAAVLGLLLARAWPREQDGARVAPRRPASD